MNLRERQRPSAETVDALAKAAERFAARLRSFQDTTLGFGLDGAIESALDAALNVATHLRSRHARPSPEAPDENSLREVLAGDIRLPFAGIVQARAKADLSLDLKPSPLLACAVAVGIERKSSGDDAAEKLQSTWKKLGPRARRLWARYSDAMGGEDHAEWQFVEWLGPPENWARQVGAIRAFRRTRQAKDAGNSDT